MKSTLTLSFLFAFASLSHAQDAPYGSINTSEVRFTSDDNIELYADLFVVDKENATVVLFHQANSSARGEYSSIVPTLVERGFNILAVDLRSGGNLFESENRTAQSVLQEYTYCEVYPDVEASLDYLATQGLASNIIVWGSSYSASLAIQAATKREDVSGAIAFSPASGDPMNGCKPDPFLETTQKPLLILRPSREVEIPSVRQQLDLAIAHNHEVFVAEDGTHGASMLVDSRIEGDAETTWNRVWVFLDTFDEERIHTKNVEEINMHLWKPFKTALENRDWETFNQLHTDDVLRVNKYGIRIGDEYKNSVKSSYQRPDTRIREFDLWLEQRFYKGNMGYEVGYFRITTTQDGQEPSSIYRRFHVTLEKIDGKWLISQDWDTDEINGIKITEEDFSKGAPIEME